MAKRIPLQICALLGAAFAAGFIANAARSKIDWRGTDPGLIGRQVDSISSPEAAKLLDDASVLFLDVRPQHDFDLSRVRGAVSFPSGSFDTVYPEVRDFLTASGRIIVYGEETLLAVRAAEFLKARGLRPQVLEGGWQAWRARQLPVEGEATP